jgi:outer membrane immunogenic protein
MRCFLAAVAALAGLSSAALADGLPYGGRAYAPTSSWSGFYVGGQVGGAWSNSGFTFNNGAGIVESFNYNPDSVIGGGHVGIQGEWNHWVLGVEGAFNWSNLSKTDESVLSPTRFRTLTTDDIGSIVAKAGYAWDRWLLYAKGGWADARINTFAINRATGVFANPTSWEGGWTIGAGLDYLVTKNLVVGIDFNYYNFTFDRTAIATDSTIGHWYNTNSDIYAVAARVSYLFQP